MLNFGSQLKNMRKDHRYTLQDLADRSHVSKSMISKVERGEVQPTIEVASRLAKGLDISLSAMLTFDYRPRVELFEPKDRIVKKSLENAIHSEVISNGGIGSDENAELVWTKKIFQPKTLGKLWPASDGGEKYVYVLEGEIDVLLDGERYQLHTGDAIFFDMTCAYQMENVTDHPAEFYVVTKRLREWNEDSNKW